MKIWPRGSGCYAVQSWPQDQWDEFPVLAGCIFTISIPLSSVTTSRYNLARSSLGKKSRQCKAVHDAARVDLNDRSTLAFASIRVLPLLWITCLNEHIRPRQRSDQQARSVYWCEILNTRPTTKHTSANIPEEYQLHRTAIMLVMAVASHEPQHYYRYRSPQAQRAGILPLCSDSHSDPVNHEVNSQIITKRFKNSYICSDRNWWSQNAKALAC